MGINALNFDDLVSITTAGGNTLVEIDGLGSILLVGVIGAGATTVTSADFILSP